MPLLARLFAARGIQQGRLDDSLDRLLPPDGSGAAGARAADASSGKRLCVVAITAATARPLCRRPARCIWARGPKRWATWCPIASCMALRRVVDLALGQRPDVLVPSTTASRACRRGACRRKGLEVVVTDHHLRPSSTTRSLPRWRDRQLTSRAAASSKNLAGVGVMFCVLLAVRAEIVPAALQRAGARGKHLLDLVTLGTVADVVRLDATTAASWRRPQARARRPQQPGVAALFSAPATSTGQRLRLQLCPGRASAPPAGWLT